MKKIRDFTILILVFLFFLFIAISLHTFMGKYLNNYLVPVLFLIAFLLPTIIVVLALREPAKEKAQVAKKEVQQEVPALTKKVEEKKKNDSKENSSLLGLLVILLSVLCTGYFFGDDISSFLNDVKNSKKQINTVQEEKWFFLWERSLDPKNRDYRKTSAKLPAEILVRSEKSLEFEIYYKDRGRKRVAKASGLRIISNGKHYEGTWSQGHPGDPDYDYGTFHLSEINSKKYKGYTIDKTGGKVFVSLEKILP